MRGESIMNGNRGLSRPGLSIAGLGTGTGLLHQKLELSGGEKSLPTFTGPAQNPYWNSFGPMVQYRQKFPLLLLTDRPLQVDTARHYFEDARPTLPSRLISPHIGLRASVDPCAGQDRRKFLDEDRLSRARHVPWQHEPRGCEGWRNKDCTDRA